MPIPDYQTLMLPVLRLLADGAEHTAGSAIEALSDEFQLTSGEREQLVGSQRISLMASRVHWAMTYLAQAGLTERPRRGVWRITTEGTRVLSADPERIDTTVLERYEGFRSFISRSAGEPEVADGEAPESGGGGAESADMPSVDNLLRPILVALSDGQAHEFSAVVEAVCVALDLDDGMRTRRLPSGATVIENRVGWARTSLSKAGLADHPKPSFLVLTEQGAAFLTSHPGAVDSETLKRDCPLYLNWLADMGAIPATERRDRDAPTVWMVRAGEGGVHAPVFVQEGAVFVGWGAAGDISRRSLEAVTDRVADAWPEYNRRQRGQAANALYKFAVDMQPGDVVVTPEPASRTVLLGEISGDYRHLPSPVVADYSHARPVTWRARISRDELSYGAKNSLSTQITLSQPPHVPEFLRLSEAHAADGDVSPLPQRSRPATPADVVEQVLILANAVAPPRVAAEEFHTVRRTMLQMLAELHSGQLALPDFQRTFVWAPDETRELLVSMIRWFPAGALLFLQGGSATFKARAVEGAPELAERPSHLVLDGQQRLTSLYQAIYGVGDSRFFLDLGALLGGADVDQAVKVFSVERARHLESIEAQARTLMMPLSAVRDFGAARWRDAVVPLRDDEDRERVRDLLREVEYSCIDPLVKYAFPLTVLPEGTSLEAVCTIFETLNRTGRPLTPFELVSARAFAGGHSLYDLWNDALERHPILGDFGIKPYYLLQCIALRLALSCKRRSVISLPADDIAHGWESAVNSMGAVLTMLRDECGVLTPKWLPYEPMLIPLATVWNEVAATSGPAHGAMRTKLRTWFWCASCTGEYESSSATLAERDAPALKSWLTGGDEPQVVRAFEWDPERWRTVTTRQQGLYRATMALTLRQRPRDFHTGAPLTPELIEAGRIDDHHVFPRAYLRTVDNGDHLDSVLNHCLIDRATNIGISNRAPSSYLAEIRTELRATLDDVLRSHSLPVGPESPLLADDFDAFLDWRQHALQEALASVTGKAVTAAVRSPERSSLDVEVEGVELELRRLIADTLDGQPDALPSHVSAKITERITAARRRNPGMENGHYESLSGKLEYCDLRELQDVLTSKILWPQFEERFASKEMLNVRFAQLAELRNRLRHSRTVDDVTRKDGEAALLWFRQVLPSR
ncbi:MAG: winged helix-turn-helix domain-containing protein [Solirubrobacteraceae bacterium]